MFNKIAFVAALSALTFACGSKKSKSTPNVQPPVGQQPVGTDQNPPPATSNQSQSVVTQAVGLYQQSDNSNVYIRIDNQMNFETTLQLPVRAAGSDNRLTPTFPQILRQNAAGQLETLGYVNRGGNTFDNVTLKVTPVNGGQILDVTMTVKLRQGDTVVSTTASALDTLKDDETYESHGRRCGRRCNNGCGGCNNGCGGGIVMPLPIPVGPVFPGGVGYPGYPGGVYPGGGTYPGYPTTPGAPTAPGAGTGDGGTYPIPPTTTSPGNSTCTDGTCVGEPLEDKEFVYRFIRIG